MLIEGAPLTSALLTVLGAYYTTLLNFIGAHPIFCFFTFPAWVIALLLPALFIAGVLDGIAEIFKAIRGKR